MTCELRPPRFPSGFPSVNVRGFPGWPTAASSPDVAHYRRCVDAVALLAQILVPAPGGGGGGRGSRSLTPCLCDVPT